MSEGSKESTALEDIVSEYIEVRDKVRDITREYETKVEGLKTRKDELKAKLLEVCRSIGADSNFNLYKIGANSIQDKSLKVQIKNKICFDD